LGIAHYKTGNKNQSQIFLKELSSKSLKPSSGSPSYFAASVYAAMEEKEKALQSLHKAYADHEVDMVWLKVDPLFEKLKGDPQFESLLHKIGFESELGSN